MTTSNSGEAAISNDDSIPSPHPVDADIETPPALQSSEMIIEGLERVQDTSIRNKETEEILMPPPEIENDEIELPLLNRSADDIELPKLFPSEIPDSDATSNGSPINEGGKLGHARIRGDTPLTFYGVDEVPPSSLDSSNEIIANEGLTTDAKDEEMEQATLTPQYVDLGDIAPEQADISSKAISTILIEDAKLFNRVATKENESNNQPNVVQESSTTQGTDTADMSDLNISPNELPAFHSNNSNSAKAFPEKEPLAKFDTPVIKSSGTVVSSLARPIKSVPNIPSSSSNEAPQISLEEKGKTLLSTKDSSFQAEIENGNSTQEKDVETPITPIKRSENSHNKDIMMAELKAIKISSLQSRNSALEQEITQKRAKLEEITRELQYPAAETVKKHITLLHDYNDIRDVGQGLIGMIADNRGVRIGDLYDEFGVGLKD